MKLFFWPIAITLTLILFVTPVFAQDDGDTGGGGGFGAGFGAGFGDSENDDDGFASEGFGGQGSGPKIDPLVDLRTWLARASAPPLDKKQEKPLNKLYEKEVKAMAKSFEKQFGVSLESALAAQNPGRGRRGAARTTPEQTAELRRLSEQLVNKVIAGLRLDQQGALRTYQSEELRVRRTNVFIQSMELAGLPLTEEQKLEVENLYKRESRLRTLIIVEAKGEPHQTKVSRLETQTTQRVVALLDQTQKTALAQVRARSKGNPPEPLPRKEGESAP
jgi:hypothetical protein